MSMSGSFFWLFHVPLLDITQTKNRLLFLYYLSIYPINFPIKNMQGFNGCERVGLDDKLAITFSLNTAKQTGDHIICNDTANVVMCEFERDAIVM